MKLGIGEKCDYWQEVLTHGLKNNITTILGLSTFNNNGIYTIIINLEDINTFIYRYDSKTNAIIDMGTHNHKCSFGFSKDQINIYDEFDIVKDRCLTSAELDINGVKKQFNFFDISQYKEDIRIKTITIDKLYFNACEKINEFIIQHNEFCNTHDIKSTIRFDEQSLYVLKRCNDLIRNGFSIALDYNELENINNYCELDDNKKGYIKDAKIIIESSGAAHNSSIIINKIRDIIHLCGYHVSNEIIVDAKYNDDTKLYKTYNKIYANISYDKYIKLLEAIKEFNKKDITVEYDKNQLIQFSPYKSFYSYSINLTFKYISQEVLDDTLSAIDTILGKEPLKTFDKIYTNIPYDKHIKLVEAIRNFNEKDITIQYDTSSLTPFNAHNYNVDDPSKYNYDMHLIFKYKSQETLDDVLLAINNILDKDPSIVNYTNKYIRSYSITDYNDYLKLLEYINGLDKKDIEVKYLPYEYYDSSIHRSNNIVFKYNLTTVLIKTLKDIDIILKIHRIE